MHPPEAPPQGLPVIQRPLDNTAVSAYMTCPKEYELGMVRHMRAAGISPALDYGGLWHKMLEVHYKTGGDQDYVRMAWMKRGMEPVTDPEEHRTPERAWVDYLGYVKKYGAPQAETGKTVGWPHAPLVEVVSSVMGGGLIHPWTVKIDRIIEVGGLYWVEDHKTTSRFDRNYWKQYENSNQMLGYVYAANLLFPQINIVGTRVNLLHLLKGGSNYEREYFPYSKGLLEEWKDNANHWMQRIAADTESGVFLKHFGDNGCSRKFGMCQYHRVCSAAPKIRENKLKEEFTYNPWNPLELDD